jgi:hypothetical protein
MLRLVARVRQWWHPGPASAAAPYEVACACGEVLRGRRLVRHQVRRCGRCGQSVFVLPSSPLAEGGTSQAQAGTAGGPAGRNRQAARSVWLWPLLAAVPTLALVVGAYAVVLQSFRQPPPASAPRGAADSDTHLEAGRKALAVGKFRLAADELQQAVARLESRPEGRRSAEARDAAQLHRQAALLADLLSQSVGEILQLAAGSHEEEWQAKFTQDYRTRAVVFDADVTRDGAGQYRIDYHVRAGAEPARIEVGDLKLLAALPRERPPRLLFGARLASVSREPGGVWVVRFQPDSGVLLTDPGAGAACCPLPVDDDELPALLRRQKAWLDELP